MDYHADEPPLHAALTAGKLAIAACQALLVGGEVAEAARRRDFSPGPPFTRAALTRLQASLAGLPEVLAQADERMGAGAAAFDSRMNAGVQRVRGDNSVDAATETVSMRGLGERLRTLADGPMAGVIIDEMLPPDGGGNSGGGAPDDGGGGGGQSSPEPVVEPPSAADAFYMPVASFAAETLAAAGPHLPGVEAEAQRAIDAALAAIGTGQAPSVSDINATITGIVVGAAFALGGWVGAALAALAALLVPRMLAAFEEQVGPDQNNR